MRQTKGKARGKFAENGYAVEQRCQHGCQVHRQQVRSSTPRLRKSGSALGMPFCSIIAIF